MSFIHSPNFPMGVLILVKLIFGLSIQVIEFVGFGTVLVGILLSFSQENRAITNTRR